MSCATSASCATACITRPVRVRLRNSCRRPISTTPNTMIHTSCGETTTPEKRYVELENSSG